MDEKKRTTMSVPEMRQMLGLGKTDSYWLVHRQCFETIIVAGKMRVVIDSFEHWYANQIKYKKVDGSPPGTELRAYSYSVQEVAELLGVSDDTVYALIKRDHIETFEVDTWMRIRKDVFEAWYKTQTKYRTQADRERDAELETASMTMPEMARQLGITRNQVYGILNSQKYQHFFEFVMIADRKRITKESFQKFLEGQDEYHLDPANDYEELAMEENVALANYRRKKLAQTGERGRNGNLQYLTIDEAAFMAKVSRSMINVWYTKGYFPVVKIRNHVRIKRKEFEAWLEKRNTERGC